jgi:hypothetical protein
VGDRSECQIFIKIPFLFWGDPRVKQRAEAKMAWYALTAAINLVQGCGRSVRNMDDIAPSYVLDAKWNWWFPANEKLFPPCTTLIFLPNDGSAISAQPNCLQCVLQLRSFAP